MQIGDINRIQRQQRTITFDRQVVVVQFIGGLSRNAVRSRLQRTDSQPAVSELACRFPLVGLRTQLGQPSKQINAVVGQLRKTFQCGSFLRSLFQFAMHASEQHEMPVAARVVRVQPAHGFERLFCFGELFLRDQLLGLTLQCRVVLRVLFEIRGEQFGTRTLRKFRLRPIGFTSHFDGPLPSECRERQVQFVERSRVPRERIVDRQAVAEIDQNLLQRLEAVLLDEVFND